jgi:hypothetical protein
MGSFFTAVHVRAPAGKEESTRATVVELVSHLAKGDVFVPCEEGEPPDRSIAVGRAGAWICVFDEATESQNVNVLDALAKMLRESLWRGGRDNHRVEQRRVPPGGVAIGRVPI